MKILSLLKSLNENFPKTSFPSDGSTFPPISSNRKNPTMVETRPWSRVGPGVCWEDHPKKSQFGYHSRTLLQHPPTTLQPTGSQSSSAQELNRSWPEPGSSSSDSVISLVKTSFFSKKIVRIHNIGRKRGQNSKHFSCRSKNIFIRFKNIPRSCFAAPSSEKPYSAGMSKIQKLHEKPFFLCGLCDHFFSSKMVSEAKKPWNCLWFMKIVHRDPPLDH